MAKGLRLDASTLSWPRGRISAELDALQPGHVFDIPDVMFAKILPEQVQAWEARFGGAPVA
jgi:methionyl-tRNA synthetase